MLKLNKKKLKAVLILFTISIIIALILSFTITTIPSFIIRLSNNLFIVASVILMVGVFFQLSKWFVHKKYVRKPIDKNELDVIENKSKDAGIVYAAKKNKEVERKKNILKLLWFIFVIVGSIDLLFSLIILKFK